MEMPEETSGYRFYSIGRVAANKKRGSNVIEVIATERLPNLSGEITDHKATMSVKVAGNDDNDAWDADLDTSPSIPAEWAPYNTNRITSPDVRRGEYVMLYKFADAEVIYWTEFKTENVLRRLETVTYVFSNERKENIPLTEDNVYTLTVSTHDKHITITTTKSDGEPYAYLIQLNTKEGFLMAKDDDGQVIFMESKNRRIYAANKDQSFIDINKREIIIQSPDKITMNSKDIIFNGKSSIHSQTPKYTINASGSYSATTPTYTVKGSTTLNGTLNVTGNVRFDGSHYTAGMSTEAGGSTGPNNMK